MAPIGVPRVAEKRERRWWLQTGEQDRSGRSQVVRL